jgi:RNA polymerase sigma factor (sigma-70 family)
MNVFINRMNGTVAILPNELALVARATAEPAAFARIYDHYFPRVYNYVRYRIADPDTTDDLTAMVFERALRSLTKYQPVRGPFGAWLFAIARNAVNDESRKQKRKRWLSLEALHEVLSSQPSPEQIVVEEETRDRLLAALTHLNRRERDLIALKFAAGLSNRHIAELTGLGQNHVGVIIYRAIQQLRIELEDTE